MASQSTETNRKVDRPLKLRLKDFRDSAICKTCIVCGTGPSIKQIKSYHIDQCYVIGVNTIGDYLTPDACIMLDRTDISDSLPDEINAKHTRMITDNPARYVFNKRPIECRHSKVIRFGTYMITMGGIDKMFVKDMLFAFNTTTITAISLAMYMGFKKIGVVGFDVSGHAIECNLVGLNHACQLITDYCHLHGVEIMNLSAQSLIETIPKVSMEQFEERCL